MIILAAAVAVRIIYMLQLHGSDLEWILPLDMRFYRELAGQLSQGRLPGGGLTFNPLYPVFLAAVFRAAGKGLLVPRLIQTALGVFTIYLHYAAGKEVSVSENRHRTGFAAAGLALLYPHFLLYEGSFLATSLVVFLMIASFVIAVRLDREIAENVQRGRRLIGRGLLLGLILGAGSLGRPNLFLLLIPASALWFFFRRRGPGKRSYLVSGALLLGSFVILAVPAGYNAIRTGRFMPVTSHGGINFYIGNRPEAEGIYSVPAGMRMDMRGLVEDARKRASALSGREMTDQEASSYWFSRALEEISGNPGEWIKLMLRKFALFWNGAEIPDVIDISFYRDECPVMKLLFIPFSLISALALGGLAVIYIIGKNRSIFTVYTAAAMFSVIIFYVNSRYRIPAVPVMILAGSVFIDRVMERVEKKRWKESAVTLCALPVIFFGFVNRDMVDINRSAMYTFMGNEYIEKGMEEKARKMFETAYRKDPDSVETRINYARILLRTGDTERAEAMYRSAFKSFPQFPRLAIEYGAVLLENGERERAERLFRWAYRNRETAEKVMACRYLSRLAYADGDRDRAAGWIRKALELVPGDRDLVEMLNRLERP